MKVRQSYVRPIILAGGQGTRLWPLSRKEMPKQFIAFQDDNLSLFQNTLINMANVLRSCKVCFDVCSVVSNSMYDNVVVNQLSQCNAFDNYEAIFESENKGTATALLSASEFDDSDQDDEILLVIPSDHGVKNLESFSESISKAINLAENNQIVLLGVNPAFASSDYGYIEINNDLDSQVISFHEKPNNEIAEKYLVKGNFYWNSGIFIFKKSVWRQLAREYCDISRNYISGAMKSIVEVKDISCSVKKIYFEYIGQSQACFNIDDTVMEQACKKYHLTMVPILSQWSDLGTYAGIYNFYDKDSDANVIRGQVTQVNSKNCFLYSTSKPLVSVGLRDVVVLELNDITFLFNITESQTSINNAAIRALSEKNIENEKKVLRPWGWYEVLHKSDNYLIKKLWINPKSSISLQYHNSRSEHWYVVKGLASVSLNNSEFTLQVNQSIDIPNKSVHKLANKSDSELIILEIQFGEFISELDIVRLEDVYGRV